MTAETKAPLPDVIVYLLGEGPLDGCHYPDFPDNGEKYKRRYWWRSALRAHIAAQQAELDDLRKIVDPWNDDYCVAAKADIEKFKEEIEALKADNATLYKGQQDMCADIREKQAEIERLRGERQWRPIESAPRDRLIEVFAPDCNADIVPECRGPYFGPKIVIAKYDDSAGFFVSESHSATHWREHNPPAGEPCKTCGGDGWTKEGGKPFNDCPVCNGTGRK